MQGGGDKNLVKIIHGLCAARAGFDGAHLRAREKRSFGKFEYTRACERYTYFFAPVELPQRRRLIYRGEFRAWKSGREREGVDFSLNAPLIYSAIY